MTWGAAIAQWIRLRLPSCRPGFESIYIVQIVYLSFELECEKNKNKQKRPGLAHLKKMTCLILRVSSFLTFQYEFLLSFLLGK